MAKIELKEVHLYEKHSYLLLKWSDSNFNKSVLELDLEKELGIKIRESHKFNITDVSGKCLPYTVQCLDYLKIADKMVSIKNFKEFDFSKKSYISYLAEGKRMVIRRPDNFELSKKCLLFIHMKNIPKELTILVTDDYINAYMKNQLDVSDKPTLKTSLEIKNKYPISLKCPIIKYFNETQLMTLKLDTIKAGENGGFSHIIGTMSFKFHYNLIVSNGEIELKMITDIPKSSYITESNTQKLIIKQTSGSDDKTRYVVPMWCSESKAWKFKVIINVTDREMIRKAGIELNVTEIEELDQLNDSQKRILEGIDPKNITIYKLDISNKETLKEWFIEQDTEMTIKYMPEIEFDAYKCSGNNLKIKKKWVDSEGEYDSTGFVCLWDNTFMIKTSKNNKPFFLYLLSENE